MSLDFHFLAPRSLPEPEVIWVRHFEGRPKALISAPRSEESRARRDLRGALSEVSFQTKHI